MTPAKKKTSLPPEEERILPHDLTAEKATLGSILSNPAAWDTVTQILQAGDFFRRGHAAVFAAMKALEERRGAIDAIPIIDELRKTGDLDEAGGPAYVMSLTDGIPRTANAVHYAGIVREKAILRRVIALGQDIAARAYLAEEAAEAIVHDADREVIDLQRGTRGGNLVDLRDTTAALYEEIEYRVSHPGELLGMPTGFESLDAETYGWQAGDLVVLGARPSIGKTVFSMDTAIAAAELGKKVAYFSLEMRRRQLERRMLSKLSRVPMQRIQSGYLGEGDFEKLSEALTHLHALPLFIDDKAGRTAQDIRAACRQMRSEHGLDLVLVDYVQLMQGSLNRRGATRNEEVTDISRRMKLLADELAVPVLLLSQLSRARDDRGDKKPRLEDLRESGALEQDADIVLFLHRKNHREGGTTSAILEKQRNGPTGTVDLNLLRETQHFEDGPDPADKLRKQREAEEKPAAKGDKKPPKLT